MLGSDGEGATGYIGCIGQDAFGEQLKAAASKDGLATHYMEDKTAPTGTCAVLVQDKERSLVANLSAANNYKIDHMNTEAVQAVVQAAKVVYSAGFFLTVSPASMIAAGKHCAETGGYFTTNLSAPFLCAVFKEQMHSVLPYADIVFGNESEAAAFAEANEFAGASVAEVALKISTMPKASGAHGRVVVITQGSESTIVAKDGKVAEYAVTPIDEAAIVDTNGAGDAFVGGFLAKFLLGQDIAKCVAAGHWAAGQVIQQSGCVFPKECTFSG
jgi:adenosine kinase